MDVLGSGHARVGPKHNTVQLATLWERLQPRMALFAAEAAPTHRWHLSLSEQCWA